MCISSMLVCNLSVVFPQESIVEIEKRVYICIPTRYDLLLENGVKRKIPSTRKIHIVVKPMRDSSDRQKCNRVNNYLRDYVCFVRGNGG